MRVSKNLMIKRIIAFLISLPLISSIVTRAGEVGSETEYIEFSDLGFKLVVIDTLMYEKNVLPPFKIREFIKEYRQRKIDIEEEGYEVIPEVLDWFKNYKVPAKHAPDITELYQNGNQIYHEIWPFWHGEDDTFNVKSASDSKHFPNLKSVTLFYDERKSKDIVSQFIALGIKAEYL